MSASREKKIRQDDAWSDPRTAREAEQRAAEKKSNRLYLIIGIAFAVVFIISILWNSGLVLPRMTAVSIDGEKYTVGELNFYVQNAYQSFANQNMYYLDYLGIDTNSPLKGQVMSATAAEMMGAQAGDSWYEHFKQSALDQMAAIQHGVERAEQEGFEFPEGMTEQYEDSLANLKKTAEDSGFSSVNKYLKATSGDGVTEKVYEEHILRMLKYTYYMDAYEKSLTYSDEELEAAYAEDPKSYDYVAYEYVFMSDNDADETVTMTAQELAEHFFQVYWDGGDLQEEAKNFMNVNYYDTDRSPYYSSTISDWLFDEARERGEAGILQSGDYYYMVVFKDRYRDAYKTIDVRHILYQLETGTIAAGEDGYDEEQAELKAAARAKADATLASWRAGEATEESFAAIARTESADSSKYDGGLYTAVSEGQMVAEFNNWCFDKSRKPGDTDVVDTSYGSHVMYYVGDNIPHWEAQVTEALREKASNELADSFAEADIQEAFAMRFVG